MPTDANHYELDPVFLNSRREARFILVTFFLFGFYTIGVSYGLGLGIPTPDREIPPPRLILGMPHWVFWGIVVPWLAANLVTAWFCFVFMKDDPLAPSEASSPTGAVPPPGHEASEPNVAPPQGANLEFSTAQRSEEPDA